MSEQRSWLDPDESMKADAASFLGAHGWVLTGIAVLIAIAAILIGLL